LSRNVNIYFRAFSRIFSGLPGFSDPSEAKQGKKHSDQLPELHKKRAKDAHNRIGLQLHRMA
jgi:hypothetical protein